MANNCYNRLLLTGGPGKVEAAKQLFTEIRANQETHNTFHFPDFLTAANSHMWDILPEGEYIRFQTVGAPNLGALQQIADHFEVGFVNRYEEPNGHIYGEAVYENSLLSDIALSPHDFAEYHFDEKQGKFIYGARAMFVQTHRAKSELFNLGLSTLSIFGLLTMRHLFFECRVNIFFKL